MQLEKERKLRHVEEDYMFSVNTLQEELRKKNELLRMEEERQIQTMVEKEKRHLMDKNDERMQTVFQEKAEINKALEFEREEQERLERAISK
jgi:anti-sigma-K factor RskA